MQLKTLLENITLNNTKPIPDCEIYGIAYDSRQVQEGYLFICIKGLNTDGHLYAQEAVQRGARAVLGEEVLSLPPEIIMVQTENTRAVLPVLASNYYGNPSRQLKLIGVTGTNGKTTVTHIIKAILEEAGYKVGIIGTLYASVGLYLRDMGHTTPESIEIEQFLSECVKQNAHFVIMEVSSHALAMQRVEELSFHSAVYTNLTQDHLDFHHDMTAYKEAKLSLFKKLAGQPNAYGIVNADDEYGGDFLKGSPVTAYTYGMTKKAAVKADKVQYSMRGTIFTVNLGQENITIEMKLIGRFNVYNALAAIAVAWQEGIDAHTIKKALGKMKGVAGRFEQVDCGQDYTVIVDYAHTPDGLENILTAAREIAKNKIITVFGCGGGRDRGKRPLMGGIAAKHSDFTIITTDNPRHEEPESIIAEIMPGMGNIADSSFMVIIDRYEAIRQAVKLAEKNDMVIIAGKGHETYQLVKEQVLDFDDRKVAAALIKERLVHEAHP